MVSDKADRGKAYQVEMEDGSMVTRYERDWDVLPGLFSPAKSQVLGMEKDTVVKSPGITAGTINDYLLPEDRVVVGGKSDYTVNVLPTFGGKVKEEKIIEPRTAFEDANATNKLEIPDVSQNINIPGVSVTGASRRVDIIELPVKSWVNKYSGGRTGEDVSASGKPLDEILLPLSTPRNSAMHRGDWGFTIGGTKYRKSKRASPVIKRDIKSISVKKPYGLMTVDDHSILKNIGKDFFKFKVGSPDKIIKSNSARVNSVGNINTDKFGVNKTKKYEVKLPNIQLKKGKDVTAINVNNILNKTIKKIKPK